MCECTFRLHVWMHLQTACMMHLQTACMMHLQTACMMHLQTACMIFLNLQSISTTQRKVQPTFYVRKHVIGMFLTAYITGIWNHARKGDVGLSWSYGSWIYSYLFNQCLSPSSYYVIKFVRDLRQVGVFLWLPSPIKLPAMI